LIYDISLPVHERTVTFPGDPAIRFHPAARLAQGHLVNLTAVEMCVHTGTHFDAPWHFIESGMTSAEVPLDAFLGPALVAGIPEVMAVGRAELEKLPLAGVERLLLKTRNSSFLRDPEFHTDFTYLAGDGAEYLAALGVKLVAIDYFSIDQYNSKGYPAHHALLSQGVVILEAVDLSQVPPGMYELICLPMKLAGLDGAPVRAILRVPGSEFRVPRKAVS
jgi:arylformamidase